MTLGRHFLGQNRQKKTFLGGNSDYQGLNIDLTRSETSAMAVRNIIDTISKHF